MIDEILNLNVRNDASEDNNDQRQQTMGDSSSTNAILFAKKRIFDKMMESDEFVIFDEEVTVDEVLNRFSQDEIKAVSRSVLKENETWKQLKEETDRVYNETKVKYHQQILNERKKSAIDEARRTDWAVKKRSVIR
jgi:hypothetical protein